MTRDTDNTYTLILNGQAHRITIAPDRLEELANPDPDDPRDYMTRIFDELMAHVMDDPDAPVPVATDVAMLRYPFGV